MRVALIGDVMLDVVVRPRGPYAPTSDTPADVRITRGGSAANLAASLVRSGHDVTYVGALGDDAAGELWLEDVASLGVHALVQRVAAPTGVVVALVGADAQRSMFTERGANASLGADFVAHVLEDGFEHLHVSGYSILDPSRRAIAASALTGQRSRGATTSVDVCSVGPLLEVGASAFAEVVSGVDFLFANQEEAEVLTGAPLGEALAALRALAGEGLVTRGAHGALAFSSTQVREAPAAEVDVLDTTGAGDAASGAYLGARLAGSSIAEALERSMLAASEVLGGLGAAG